jgi:phosphomannomutase
VFERAGLRPPLIVDEQRRPDPDFPTAAFPNPEEPGVMDRVLALGERAGADVVLANDPDADRCAVAVGGRLLSGDDVGLLLADYVLRTCRSSRSSRSSHGSRNRGGVATTVVSSTALRGMAAGMGVPYTETLTGFKWIMRADPELVFGYEEALGYAVAPEVVRDKDGITAALAVARIAAEEKRRGRTLLDRLDDLARRYGVFATAQVAVRFDDLARIGAAMRRLRTSPPTEIGGEPVAGLRDLQAGGGPLPPSDVLLFDLADGGRVALRPSGTEPKLKAYLEAVAPVGPGPAGLAEARAQASDRLDRLRTAIPTMI